MKRLFAHLLTVLAVLFLSQSILAQEPDAPQRPPPDQRAGPNPDVLFSRLDANQDGVITPDELPPGMPEAFKQLVLSADRNGDGKITKDELTDMLNQRRPGPGREMPPPDRRMPGPDARPAQGQQGPEPKQVVEAYKLRTADPQTVLKVMNTILAGTPGVRMDVDPKSSNLIVLAQPAQHNVIRTVLMQMERPRDVVDDKPGDAAGPPFGRQGGGPGWQGGPPFGRADGGTDNMAGPPFGRPGWGPGWQGGPPFGRADGGTDNMAGPPFGRPGWGLVGKADLHSAARMDEMVGPGDRRSADKDGDLVGKADLHSAVLKDEMAGPADRISADGAVHLGHIQDIGHIQDMALIIMVRPIGLDMVRDRAVHGRRFMGEDLGGGR